MASLYRNSEHSQSIESSFSQSMSHNQSNGNEPSSSVSFLADNREILKKIQPTTMKLMSSDQENSVSLRQMNPKYPRGRFVRVNSRDDIDNINYNHYKEQSVSKSKSKTKSKTRTKSKTNIHRKNCCGYPEHKSDEIVNNRSNIKRRPKHNIKIKKYSDDDTDDSYNINNDIIAGLQKSRRSKSISNSNGNEQKEILEHLEKYRKLNGVIFGKLDKFQGDDMTNIHFKKTKEKFVVYVPQKQLLFYAKNKDSNDQTTIISVKGIEMNDLNITKQLKRKYRDKYFCVIGHTRMVLFAASSHKHQQIWYKVIRNSLAINISLIETRLSLNDQYYIDGWLGKFRGNSNDNIKFKKDPTSKYVIFIPQMKILFFCGEHKTKNKVKTTLVHIQKITRKNKYISRNFQLYHTEYKNSWFKVIGEKRIVVFVAKSDQERDIWFTQILKALYPTRNNNDITNNNQQSTQLK